MPNNGAVAWFDPQTVFPPLNSNALVAFTHLLSSLHAAKEEANERLWLPHDQVNNLSMLLDSETEGSVDVHQTVT